MQTSGTEWLFRLAQEPKRLLGRYSKDLWHFGLGIAAQTWRFRSRRTRIAQPKTVARASEDLRYSRISFTARLDFEEVHQRKDEIESALLPDRPAILEMDAVEFIDSTGIGLLIRLQKRARFSGQQLLLVGVSRNVRRALELMRLQEFFVMVPNLGAAEAMLRNTAGQSSSVYLKTIPASALPALAWNGELTAANAEETWIMTMDHLAARALVQRSITIDLSNLTFIDSTGLSVMIRAKKYAARQQMDLRFEGAQPNVLNVIRLSRLEDYLLNNPLAALPA
jgi:N-acetylglucosaminyldiphosphoundecaprenol N-acetyl-beta-D-mannosaminyltransferase